MSNSEPETPSPDDNELFDKQTFSICSIITGHNGKFSEYMKPYDMCSVNLEHLMISFDAPYVRIPCVKVSKWNNCCRDTMTVK